MTLLSWTKVTFNRQLKAVCLFPADSSTHLKIKSIINVKKLSCLIAGNQNSLALLASCFHNRVLFRASVTLNLPAEMSQISAIDLNLLLNSWNGEVPTLYYLWEADTNLIYRCSSMAKMWLKRVVSIKQHRWV